MSQPYPAISTQTALQQAFEQFRKSLPKSIDASVLKALEIAPKNESFVINILKFLKIINEDGSIQSENTKHFFGTNDEYQKGMSELVRSAYSDLFDLHGEDAWVLDADKMAAFFRTHDSASELMGKRKASTFSTLAEQSGKRESSVMTSTSATGSSKKKRSTTKKSGTKSAGAKRGSESSREKSSAFDLAVRVEINLPATSDQAVYQAIFKSLREDLLNG